MGLARAVSDREAAEAEAGKAFGTPYYISPEQIRAGQDVDARADLYSLGATLYHMVTGKVPFEGPEIATILKKHIREPLVPPDHVNPALSNGISEIIELCMAKDRNQRYATAADLIKDLQAVACGQPPPQAHGLATGPELAVLDQDGDAEEPPAAPDQRPWSTTPLFWTAVAGWALAALLLIVVIILLAC